MIYSHIATIIFSILLISCNDKKEEKKNNYISAKSEIKDFLFVGLIKDKAGLYKYNLDQKIYEPLWSDKREEVVELSYSKEMENVFFITAKNFGKTGAFPFINNIKLYLINPETGKADFIEKLGNGIQVFSQWEGENIFRIIINSFDKTIANYVYHRKILYNVYGKKLEDITETYDITKQGYPQPSGKKINYFSPDEKYSIRNKEDDSTEIYLIENKADKLVIKINQQIKQIEWADGLLFISFIKVNQDDKNQVSEKIAESKLIIYSLEKSKILMTWEGEGVKNYFIANELLIFDSGFGKDSHIFIYNLENMKIFTEIKINGGCGLKNIPQMPDYGVYN